MQSRCLPGRPRSRGGSRRGIFRQPEMVVGTWRAARAEQDDITEEEARETLQQLDPVWDELFPAEQARPRSCWSSGSMCEPLLGDQAPAKRAQRAGEGSGWQQEGGGVNTTATVSADGETIIVHIPIAFRRRGGRKMIVTPDGAPWAPRPRVDNALVKALARGFRWQRMLDDGICATIEELAKREKGSTEATCVRFCG